uniref:PPUP7380 n=1 Tax=Poeciliopsis prolifica TaxID=188132 RepID=A0A0S7EYC1_9TELE
MKKKMFWILLHVSLLVPAVQMLVLNGSTEVWTRSDLSLPTANTTRGDELTDQNPLNRTTTVAPQTGNLTLTVTSDPRASTKQAPQVKESFPTWARVLLVPLVVLVLVTGAVFCHFRHNFMRGYNRNIEADSGQPFVLLPCRTNGRLPSDATVEWTDRYGNKVHVYQNHDSVPEKQIQFYRTRTEMSEDPLQTGDLSLTLRFPTGADTDTFT